MRSKVKKGGGAGRDEGERGEKDVGERVGGVRRREREGVFCYAHDCIPVARERDPLRAGRARREVVRFVPGAAPEKDEREAGEPASEDEKPAALVVVASMPHEERRYSYKMSTSRGW